MPMCQTKRKTQRELIEINMRTTALLNGSRKQIERKAEYVAALSLFSCCQTYYLDLCGSAPYSLNFSIR